MRGCQEAFVKSDGLKAENEMEGELVRGDDHGENRLESEHE